MVHVVVSVGKNLIESVITKRSADETEAQGWRYRVRGDQVHRTDAGKELTFLHLKATRRIRGMDRLIRALLPATLNISWVVAAKASATFSQPHRPPRN